MYKQIGFIDLIFIADTDKAYKGIFVHIFETLEHLIKCSSVFFIALKCRSPPAFEFQKF